MRSARRNQCGFDVRAHVAQLRRKHAEFNWFPSLLKPDVTSPLITGDIVDEEPFPPRSNGPQCVPGTPTLGINDFFELQNSEWPWQPPSFHNRENVTLDLFNDQNGVPGRPFSVPSLAVATREQFQEDLIISFYFLIIIFQLHFWSGSSEGGIILKLDEPHSIVMT
ncbi:PREDICTED: uncharacterized protein LOC107342214 [Acropora digitifera]|uniref:uncharacterized protein LOC107342214 n=1 Tax=Acropora digitifera TaxID=70779 RepID=UPI00077AC04F|nr:PREDICTED: uncharacterized protein LOC107342214 [Acropora digitifera]